jgi:hypothetical protein
VHRLDARRVERVVLITAIRRRLEEIEEGQSLDQ